MTKKIRVLIVDRRELFREGLAVLLSKSPNIEVICTCATGDAAVEKILKFKPDICIADVEQTTCDYVSAIRTVAKALPNTGQIVLTHSKEDHYVLSTIKAGARAYLTKDISVEGLVGAINRVHSGETIISAPMAERLLAKLNEADRTYVGNNAKLSRREREVLSLIAKNATNQEIARILCISDCTVKVHVRNIIEKLHVHDRHQAALVAIDRGIISLYPGEVSSPQMAAISN